MRTFLLTSLLALAFALGLSGCGSPESQLRGDAHKLLRAIEQEDSQVFCDYIDKPSQQRLIIAANAFAVSSGQAADCSSASTVYVSLLNKTKNIPIKADLKKIDKAKITISGDTATIAVGNQRSLVAHRSDGRWRFRIF